MKIIPLTAQPPKTYAVDRRCFECGIRLSRYNEDDYCSIHQPEPDWRYCGMEFVRCEECGGILQVTSKRANRRCGECR